MNAYTEALIETATADHWSRGEGVPIDLFCEMTAAGLDVQGLEAKHRAEPQ